MGFGFNIFIFPVLALLFGLAVLYSIIKVVLAIINKEPDKLRTILKAWLIGIGVIICIGVSISLIRPKHSKIIVTENDTAGEYIIDRKMFAGKQADWQYDHYRFEIKNDKTFLFYLTDKEKILKTYQGYVTYNSENRSVRIKIQMNDTKHHIIEQNPTLYRSIGTFYYVFKSNKFGNIFFKKGSWSLLNK